MVNCGLRAAFVWLCKPQTVEDHVLYHAAVVSRCTRLCAYPQQQSFAMCRWRAPDERTQKFKKKLKRQSSCTGMDDYCVAIQFFSFKDRRPRVQG